MFLTREHQQLFACSDRYLNLQAALKKQEAFARGMDRYNGPIILDTFLRITNPVRKAIAVLCLSELAKFAIEMSNNRIQEPWLLSAIRKYTSVFWFNEQIFRELCRENGLKIPSKRISELFKKQELINRELCFDFNSDELSQRYWLTDLADVRVTLCKELYQAQARRAQVY